LISRSVLRALAARPACAMAHCPGDIARAGHETLDRLPCGHWHHQSVVQSNLDRHRHDPSGLCLGPRSVRKIGAAWANFD
jgi:hypothetical protein